MVEKMWYFDIDTGAVDWGYAYPAKTENQRWFSDLIGDGTQYLKTVGVSIFFTEQDATIGLLNALKESKEEIERMIAATEEKIRHFE